MPLSLPVTLTTYITMNSISSTNLHVSNRFEIRARKGVVEDELSDWVSKRKKFFNDELYSDNGGGYSRGGSSRGGGRGRGDFNGGYRNSETSGENRGSYGGNSSRGGRGRFGVEFGTRDDNGGRGGRG
nr:hypothetical protein [Tanacetum cinerariifolium]